MGSAPGVATLYRLTPSGQAWSAAVLFCACAAYCIGLWSGGRRTLPMQTWQLRLTTTAGAAVGLAAASLRFVACWAGPALALAAYLALRPLGEGRWAVALLAVNYAWALVDRDGALLQDRLAGTRLSVAAPRPD